MKLTLISIFTLYTGICFSQTDSSKGFSFFGYIEGYYIKDFSSSKNDVRPAFFNTYTRHNDPNIPNINVVIAKIAWHAPQFRANAGIMLGTYPVYALANEPVVFDRVYELNAGIKLGTKKNVWLDGGIFRSHIGAETILGKDQPNLTRSLSAETSPYYETGARLSYTSPGKKFYLAAFALNGWQRIATKQDKGAVATGMQLKITPNPKLAFNYSNYIGNGTATKKTRHYHNIYGFFKPSDRWMILAGIDIGFQDIAGDKKKESWFSPLLITSYALGKKLKLAARAEYYADKNGIMIAAPPGYSFKTWGYSGNIDYQFLKDCMFRAEYRLLQSKYPLFADNGNPSNDNRAIALALIIWFN